MPLFNTRARWGWPAQALHWMVAALVGILMAVGFSMVWLVTDFGRKFELYQLHKSLGILALLLVALRLAWRGVNRDSPPPPATLSSFERRAARLTQRGLYLLLVLMPLTGWLMASASTLGIPTVVFGLAELPTPVGPNAALESWMKLVHGALAAALLALVTLHVAAALKHHFVIRDDVLARMLPSRRVK